MNEPIDGLDRVEALPRLDELAAYMTLAGWTLEDADARSALWRPSPSGPHENLRVALPTRETVVDYEARIREAIKTLAWAEGRLASEVADDIGSGGADTVAVRLTPDAPSGEAPLGLAHAAIGALRNLVIGSAAALDLRQPVLPARRPARAESYADGVRLSTAPGSFVLTLALPLLEVDVALPAAGPDALLAIPPQPFGRRVTNRMLTAARRAQRLADEVGTGRQPLRAFGEATPEATNATELDALSALGGPDYQLYQLRFAQSPLAPGFDRPVRLTITPGQQLILHEAADFLRTRQPRSGVTVVGLVVRLFRASTFGPGEAVVEGADDDSGTVRRYRLELAEDDYAEAVRAHQDGLQVVVTGDLEARGTRLALRRLRAFAVLPGLGDE